jgi:hypothetical protein
MGWLMLYFTMKQLKEKPLSAFCENAHWILNSKAKKGEQL